MFLQRVNAPPLCVLAMKPTPQASLSLVNASGPSNIFDPFLFSSNTKAIFRRVEESSCCCCWLFMMLFCENCCCVCVIVFVLVFFLRDENPNPCTKDNVVSATDVVAAKNFILMKILFYDQSVSILSKLLCTYLRNLI